MSYQTRTGSIMANSHPGSYCGQDAYNDMLVTEDGNSNGNRTSECRNNVGGCPTLNCASEQPILLRTEEDEDMEDKTELIGTVRRLTPMECERLQGFPDGWTDIGEWIDSKGKKHETVDSARYKALGNSIALPFWFVLLRRISAVYDRPATLGSLFDGIGGFPLCWERCNGVGTAIWASEIEEFPIAVTKIHFPEPQKGNE